MSLGRTGYETFDHVHSGGMTINDVVRPTLILLQSFLRRPLMVVEALKNRLSNMLIINCGTSKLGDIYKVDQIITTKPGMRLDLCS